MVNTIIPFPDDVVSELTQFRTMTGKTFAKADGSVTVVTGLRLAHVPSNFNYLEFVGGVGGRPFDRSQIVWTDVDTSIVWDESINKYKVSNCWYGFTIAPDKFEIEYTSKRGGKITMLLNKLDDIDIDNFSPNFKPELEDNKIVFRDVVEDLDLWVSCVPKGISVFKKLKSDRCPKNFGWDIRRELEGKREGDLKFDLASKLIGWDNADNVDDDRNNEILIRRKQRQLQFTVNSVDVDVNRVQIAEIWTGKTIDIDAATKEQTLKSDVIYPVIIDPDITEGIVTDADDGCESVGSSTWSNRTHYYYGNDIYALQYSTRRQPGWRFQGLNIPQGATINTASLTFNINATFSSGNSNAVIRGNLHTSAPAWSNSNRPSNMTQTSASANVALTTNGSKVVDVKTIIQEIVNQGGWADGNNLALAIVGGTGAGLNKTDDSTATKNASATLAVNYTAAGGAGAIPPQLLNATRNASLMMMLVR